MSCFKSTPSRTLVSAATHGHFVPRDRPAAANHRAGVRAELSSSGRSRPRPDLGQWPPPAARVAAESSRFRPAHPDFPLPFSMRRGDSAAVLGSDSRHRNATELPKSSIRLAGPTPFCPLERWVSTTKSRREWWLVSGTRRRVGRRFSSRTPCSDSIGVLLAAAPPFVRMASTLHLVSSDTTLPPSGNRRSSAHRDDEIVARYREGVQDVTALVEATWPCPNGVALLVVSP